MDMKLVFCFGGSWGSEQSSSLDKRCQGSEKIFLARAVIGFVRIVPAVGWDCEIRMAQLNPADKGDRLASNE